ncbi:hypothetical protein ACWCRD_41305 [Streptomyces sp. NPDC002092]
MTGVRVSAHDGGPERTVTADQYVCAMPVEHTRGTWGRALRRGIGQARDCPAACTA